MKLYEEDEQTFYGLLACGRSSEFVSSVSCRFYFCFWKFQIISERLFQHPAFKFFLTAMSNYNAAFSCLNNRYIISTINDLLMQADEEYCSVLILLDSSYGLQYINQPTRVSELEMWDFL